MNAGSYVISPKSSSPVLIWRRSIARIVPSLIGSSYFFPVRLSRTVSVSAIRKLEVGSQKLEVKVRSHKAVWTEGSVLFSFKFYVLTFFGYWFCRDGVHPV